MNRVSVRGMTCQGCESVVETAVEMLDGVESVDADRYENVVLVAGDVSIDAIATKVEMAGYEPLGEAEPAVDDEAEPDPDAAGDGEETTPADDAVDADDGADSAEELEE